MILRSQKRIGSSEDDVDRDRLREMPDEIIVHILSFMPTVDAVSTMLLRRFGNLWTLVGTLKFDLAECFEDIFPNEDWQHEDIRRFHLFVHNVLMLHKRPSIDKFDLSVELVDHGKSIKEVDGIKVWLRFALDRQAKEIRFQDVCEYQLYNCSGLPNFTSEYLVILELDHCILEPQLKVNLGSLKKLLLNNVTMCEEAFRRFISGCPSLQELCVVDPRMIEDLSFSAPNIGKLSLVLTNYARVYCPRMLNCPNLTSLDLNIDTYWLPNFIDVSSVRDVNLKAFYYYGGSDDSRTAFETFLGKLEASKVFKLSHVCSEKFLHAIERSSLLRNRWKHVVLDLHVNCQTCLLGFSQLMRSSGDVEELTIYTREKDVWRDPGASRDTPPLKLPSPCVMPKLKIITLHGYQKSWNRRVQLIKFLRQSSPALDKLVIVPDKHR